MNNLSIKTRLALLVGFMAALILGSGIVGIRGIADTNAALDNTYRNRLEPTVMIGKIMLLMQDNRAQVMLGIQHDPANPLAKLHDHAIDRHVDSFVKNRDEITALWKDYTARSLAPQEKTLADTFAAARGRYVAEGLAPAMEALKAAEYHKANEILLTRINPLHTEVNAAADALFKASTSAARTEYEAAEQRYVRLRTLAIAGTVVGIALAALVGFLLIRSITGPLDRVIASFERIADGKLNEAIVVDRSDEMGRCLSSLSGMQQRLRSIIGEIGQAATDIENKSINLQAGMEQVAQRSHAQLDRVQEVAAAMEEVSQSVTEVASSSEGTANAAVEAQDIVHGSHAKMMDSMSATGRVVHAVETASATIRDLSNSIQRVDQITQVIKEIADQTNLLALNAAIEAARAGEQGRGFAVVADEVRKLAERTSTSTTDISHTVGEIQQVAQNAVASMSQAAAEVEESIGLMRASSETIDSIATTSTRVTDMAQHIAAAARQQSVASQEVARNMEQLSGLIGENNASAQAANDSGAGMYQSARGLKVLVGRFQL